MHRIPFKRYTLSGFSLMELLVVMAIFAILLVLLVPAVSTILKGNRLSTAGVQIHDAIHLSRQTAITGNREAGTAFLFDAEGKLNGLQIVALEADGTFSAMDRRIVLPENVHVVADAKFSSIITDAPLLPVDRLNALPGNVFEVRYLAFLPDGTTRLFPGSAPWLISLQYENSGDLDNNFVTISVNPITGFVKTYRP